MILVFISILFIAAPTLGFNFASEYIGLIPSTILIVTGIWAIQNNNGARLVGSFIMLGFGFAFLTGELNTLGILIPDLITPNLTLAYIQVIIVIFSAIIGAALTV